MSLSFRNRSTPADRVTTRTIEEAVMRLEFTLVLFTLLTLPLASEQYSLDVKSSVDLALKNNLSLQTERIDLSTDKRARDTAFN